MNYIVLDLEFNQPFNFKNGRKTTLNAQCPFEIIQIGAVKLNNDFEITDRFNFYVKPKIYKRLHPFVEKITGITMEELKNAKSFEECYSAFIDFIGEEDNSLCTWGIDDIKALYKNILFYDLNINLISDKYINVQSYANSYLKYESGKTIGLKNAVIMLNLPTENQFHNALYDADYTAEIFKIVRHDKVVWNTFNVMDLTKKKEAKKRLNTKALVAHFQSLCGHELTEEDVNMLKAAYKLGRNQTFDVSADSLKPAKP